jgi:hypothetical protein
MIPVAESRFIEAGSFEAENRMGRCPVHGMRYRNGFPGRAPYTFGPLIFGAGPGFGVRTGPADIKMGPKTIKSAPKEALFITYFPR